MSANFASLYSHGFVRTATCTPLVAIGDPDSNAQRIAALARSAADQGAVVALFPELALSSYTPDELFFQQVLLDRVRKAIATLAQATADLPILVVVGAPLAVEGRLYNCAVAIQCGRVLGVVPKSFLPNYREFYERRYFASGSGVTDRSIQLGDGNVPFGVDLLFAADDIADFSVGIEICEDLWVPVPPSTAAAFAGATVLLNLSASNATVGKAQLRKTLCLGQATRTISAYLYSAAGGGESTTDLAWDGHAIVCDDRGLIAESDRFGTGADMLIADIDVERLAKERMKVGTWGDCADAGGAKPFRRIGFRADPPRSRDLGLNYPLDRFPFVPSDTARLDEDCYEAYNIQVHGLVQRLKASGIEKLVLGVSGGLDSTHALIVCVQTMDRLGLPRSNVLAYTLPGFGTSAGTRESAWKLMRSFGVSATEIDIAPVSTLTLADIGHPAAHGQPMHDITYENVQAGARTAYLFRLANLHNAIVIGTGDMSELALGWCTYGVGDHMSHYGVNAGVPKTMIQHLIRWVIERDIFGDEASQILKRILDTEITPELVPASEGQPVQKTEDAIGPYALQDFNLYWTVRHSLRPSKIAFLAWHAWRDAAVGAWPANIAADDRHAYDLATIKRWLRVFLFRFFTTSQFKRSALPNSPKVLSGASLSPRGDWRAPSDGNARIWLQDLDDNVPC